MADFDAHEAARRFAMMEAASMNPEGEVFEDGEGPGGIAGYLNRRAQRAGHQALKDGAIGLGAIGAGYALAPVTGGASFVPGYGIGGLNLGRALSHGGDAVLKQMASNRLGVMPEAPSLEEEEIARRFRSQGY